MRVIHVRASLLCGRPSRNMGWWRISVPILKEKGYASALYGLILHFSKTPRVESGHFPRPFPVLKHWDRISSSEIFPLSGKWELSSGAAPSRLALQAETSLESCCMSGHTSFCSSWGFTLVNDNESPNMKRPLTDFHQRTQLNSCERIKNQSQPPDSLESNTTQLSNNNQRAGNSFMGSWASKENTKEL